MFQLSMLLHLTMQSELFRNSYLRRNRYRDRRSGSPLWDWSLLRQQRVGLLEAANAGIN
jgi:hypothetical protein